MQFLTPNDTGQVKFASFAPVKGKQVVLGPMRH